jgi:hypothetical protein
MLTDDNSNSSCISSVCGVYSSVASDCLRFQTGDHFVKYPASKVAGGIHGYVFLQEHASASCLWLFAALVSY